MVQSVPANISAVQTPWAQNINANGTTLSNLSVAYQPNDVSFSGNLYKSSGSWRYVAAGSGANIYGSSSGGVIIRTAASGAAGAVATLLDVMQLRRSYCTLATDTYYLYPSTAGASVVSLLANSAWQQRWGLQMAADTANDFSIIRYYNDSGGADTPLSINRSTGNMTFGKYLILVTRTSAVDDAAAASAGVPVGGLYHNAGAVRV